MPPREFLVLCGGARPTARGRAWQRAGRVALDAPHGRGNVRLRVTDITGPLTADQAVRRGGKGEFEYGARWRRRFRFEVPVRRPDVWADAAVAAELARTVGFLSDDDYEFGFARHPDLPKFSEYLPHVSRGRGLGDADDVDSVAMFSGGLDSLAGAVGAGARACYGP